MLVPSFVAVAERSAVTPLDALPHLAGMLMVISTLAILWALCEIVALLVKALTPAPAAIPEPVEKPRQQAATAPITNHSISPELVIIIAAAVATVTGQNHRTISIKPQSPSPWEKSGRQSLLTSHRIR